ncbi:MAG: hypothetical protein PGN34_03335 [Methylobacterium frigidaeris]
MIAARVVFAAVSVGAARRGDASLVPDRQQACPAIDDEVLVREVASVVDDPDHDVPATCTPGIPGEKRGTGEGLRDSVRQHRSEWLGRLEAPHERQVSNRSDASGRNAAGHDDGPIQRIRIADLRAGPHFARLCPSMGIGDAGDDGNLILPCRGRRFGENAAISQGDDALKTDVGPDIDPRFEEATVLIGHLGSHCHHVSLTQRPAICGVSKPSRNSACHQSETS